MMAAAIARAFPLCFGPAPSRSLGMLDLSTATDTELVPAARQGDGEAITRLVERHSPRLYRYLTRLVNDPTLAEDLLQETWLRVVERLDQYDRRHPFGVWLFAVAHHCAIDTLRRRGRQGFQVEPQENEEGEVLDPVERIADPAPSVLERLAERELEERVAKMFVHLPAHYRQVLALRFQEGMQLEQISHVLRLSLSTVKTRVQRGLRLLRQRLEQMGWDDHE